MLALCKLAAGCPSAHWTPRVARLHHPVHHCRSCVTTIMRPHTETCRVAASPPPPRSLVGGAPGRAPAPLAHGGRPCPPALVALARALRRAGAHPRASMVGGVAHRTEFIFPRPRSRCGPVARPHRNGGARRRSAPWPCPQQKNNNQKGVGVWGGGGSAFEPSQGGGGRRPLAVHRGPDNRLAATRPTPLIPSSQRDNLPTCLL